MSKLQLTKFKMLMDTFNHSDILHEIYCDGIVEGNSSQVGNVVDDLFDQWMIKEGYITEQELERMV